MLKLFPIVAVFALRAVSPAQLTNSKADFWEIEVKYPRFSAKGPVARMANQVMEARETTVFRTFLLRAQGEVPRLKKEFKQAQYGLTIKPHRITDRPTLASGYVDRYDFLAGAHGTSRFEVVNYGLVGGKVRALKFRDLFRPGVDAVGQASRALVAIMKAQKETPSNVASGEWKRLTADQRERFVVGPSGVLFLFDQYDLGAGAEGPRQVLAPFSRLPGLDRRGVLRAVL